MPGREDWVEISNVLLKEMGEAQAHEIGLWSCSIKIRECFVRANIYYRS